MGDGALSQDEINMLLAGKNAGEDVFMGSWNYNSGKSIVVTAYGHNKKIDNIAVSLFDVSPHGNRSADTYCETINSLELRGEAWVFAQSISENLHYTLDKFQPLRFDSTILKLDDRSVQKVIREVYSQELAKALKNVDVEVQTKIFSNMTTRAAAMLKEDMEYMGPVMLRDVKEAQEKITSLIRHLEDTGEIIIAGEGEELI